MKYLSFALVFSLLSSLATAQSSNPVTEMKQTESTVITSNKAETLKVERPQTSNAEKHQLKSDVRTLRLKDFKIVNRNLSELGGGSTGGGDTCEETITQEIFPNLQTWLKQNPIYGASASNQISKLISQVQVVCLKPSTMSELLKDQLETEMKSPSLEDQSMELQYRSMLKDSQYTEADIQMVIAANKNKTRNLCLGKADAHELKVICNSDEFLNRGRLDQTLNTLHAVMVLAGLEKPLDSLNFLETPSHQILPYYDFNKRLLGNVMNQDANEPNCIKAMQGAAALTQISTWALGVCAVKPKESEEYKKSQLMLSSAQEYAPRLSDACMVVCARDPFSFRECRSVVLPALCGR